MSDDLEGVSSTAESPKFSAQYAGFAAGILSGWTKLVVGQPIDIIKTRLQCAPPSTYPGGAWECFTRTITKEGPRALYKGASAPAVGWSLTDGILMGSLQNYRNFLLVNGFAEPIPVGIEALERAEDETNVRLSLTGHALAGMAAGWSNAPVAHVIETIKGRLQLQYSLASAKSGPSGPSGAVSTRHPNAGTVKALSNVTAHFQLVRAYATAAAVPEHVYTGPIDVIRQTVKRKGILGMWRGFGASVLFRSNFAWMFGGFEVFRRMFDNLKGTRWEVSPGTASFLSGGLASQAYWLGALPFDNVKNRLMVDSIDNPQYRGIRHAATVVFHERDQAGRSNLRNALSGVKNFYRGIIPVALRAFPTNAAALFVWESVMKNLTK